MADFADIGAVQEVYGEIPDPDQPLTTGLLRRASAIIRAKVNQVDERIADGTLDPQTVSDVCADMVVRVLRNQEGVKQETIGPIATTFDPLVAAGRLFLTPDELYLLQPPAAARSTVGSISTVPTLSPRNDRHLRREADRAGRRRIL